MTCARYSERMCQCAAGFMLHVQNFSSLFFHHSHTSPLQPLKQRELLLTTQVGICSILLCQFSGMYVSVDICYKSKILAQHLEGNDGNTRDAPAHVIVSAQLSILNVGTHTYLNGYTPRLPFRGNLIKCKICLVLNVILTF